MAGFDIAGIDEVVHGRMRLGILTILASAEVADFVDLRGKLQATQGNLSIHLRKLEEAGYIAIEKDFVGRKPRTRARITAQGRQALLAYLDAIGALIDGVREQTR